MDGTIRFRLILFRPVTGRSRKLREIPRGNQALNRFVISNWRVSYKQEKQRETNKNKISKSAAFRSCTREERSIRDGSARVRPTSTSGRSHRFLADSTHNLPGKFRIACNIYKEVNQRYFSAAFRASSPVIVRRGLRSFSQRNGNCSAKSLMS